MAASGVPSPFADEPNLTDQVNALVALLAGKRLVVLTGAGCSTESGIPDYRGGGRPPARSPILHDAFVRRPDVRQRYWARATLAWRRFSAAAPNAAHLALAKLEREGKEAGKKVGKKVGKNAGHGRGLLRGIITQNVDGLHQDAGSERVIELHGTLAVVRCLDCPVTEDRTALQERLESANPGWVEARQNDGTTTLAPDGDAELDADQVRTFRVPTCRACGGTLMPDVVFFGGTVSAAKLAAAWSLVDEAEALLVVGSSLAVYSGFRFARGAAERGMPIAIVNMGATRADELSQLRVEAPAGLVLPALVERLLG